MGLTNSKTRVSIQLTNTLTLTKCPDGYWLYDTTRRMNLAMRAKSETDAFVEALTFYQKRLTQVEATHADLEKKVYAFVSQFVESSDED